MVGITDLVTTLHPSPSFPLIPISPSLIPFDLRTLNVPSTSVYNAPVSRAGFSETAL